MGRVPSLIYQLTTICIPVFLESEEQHLHVHIYIRNYTLLVNNNNIILHIIIMTLSQILQMEEKNLSRAN